MKKKKILISFLIVMLLFANYAFVTAEIINSATMTFERTGGGNVNTIATIVTDDLYIDGSFNAYSQPVSAKNIKVYNYNTNVEQTCTGNTARDYTEGEYYLSKSVNTADVWYLQEGAKSVFWTIRLPKGNTTCTEVATIIYQDYINYEGKSYDVKLNIDEIKCSAPDDRVEFVATLGGQSATKDGWEKSSFDIPTGIYLWSKITKEDGTFVNTGANFRSEVKCSLYIIDDNGFTVPISGLFGIEDKDIYGGLYLEGFTPTLENTFTPNIASDTIKYKLTERGTYFYSDSPNNIGDRTADMYVLLKNVSQINFTCTNEIYGDRISSRLFRRKIYRNT